MTITSTCIISQRCYNWYYSLAFISARHGSTNLYLVICCFQSNFVFEGFFFISIHSHTHTRCIEKLMTCSGTFGSTTSKQRNFPFDSSWWLAMAFVRIHVWTQKINVFIRTMVCILLLEIMYSYCVIIIVLRTMPNMYNTGNM